MLTNCNIKAKLIISFTVESLCHNPFYQGCRRGEDYPLTTVGPRKLGPSKGYLGFISKILNKINLSENKTVEDMEEKRAKKALTFLN